LVAAASCASTPTCPGVRACGLLVTHAIKACAFSASVACRITRQKTLPRLWASSLSVSHIFPPRPARYGLGVTPTPGSRVQHACPLCLRDRDDAHIGRLDVFSDFFHALVGTHPGTIPIYVPQADGSVVVGNQEGALNKVQVLGVCDECRSDLTVNVESPARPILDRIARGPAYRLSAFDLESVARWSLAITLLTASAEPQGFCGNVCDPLRSMIGDDAVPDSTMLFAFGMREGHVGRVEFRSIKATDIATGDCTVVGAASVIGIPHLTLVSLYGLDVEWLRHVAGYFTTATEGLPHVQLWPASLPTEIPVRPCLSASDVAGLLLNYGPPEAWTGDPADSL
jgi:hypothetical protein